MTERNPAPPPGRSFDPWNFRTEVAVEISGAKLTGYRVEATDGALGKVTDFRLDPGDSHLVLTTGRLFGRETVLPAGIVNHVDHAERRIYLDRTRDQVKRAPQLTGAEYAERRDELADYYARPLHPSH